MRGDCGEREVRVWLPCRATGEVELKCFCNFCVEKEQASIDCKLMDHSLMKHEDMCIGGKELNLWEDS